VRPVRGLWPSTGRRRMQCTYTKPSSRPLPAADADRIRPPTECLSFRAMIITNGQYRTVDLRERGTTQEEEALLPVQVRRPYRLSFVNHHTSSQRCSQDGLSGGKLAVADNGKTIFRTVQLCPFLRPQLQSEAMSHLRLSVHFLFVYWQQAPLHRRRLVVYDMPFITNGANTNRKLMCPPVNRP